MKPKISVIMPNYNTQIDILGEAVDSILKQTYTNFELIIVDDCSTNESYNYLQALSDSRILLIRNENNLGITKTLNIALSHARGEYIARMDSDDVSLPDRLEKQLLFMEKSPNVVVCGTYAKEIGDGEKERCRKIPMKKIYQCSVLFGNVYGLIHPTAFFRSSVLKDNNIWYDEKIETAQDYAMWAECCRYGEISNVEEVLFLYRIHKGQVSARKRELQRECTIYTLKKQLLNIMPEISDYEVEQHYKYCVTNEISREMKKWFKTIIVENRKNNYVDQVELVEFVRSFWKLKVNIVSSNLQTIQQLVCLCMNTNCLDWPTIFKNLFRRIKKRSRRYSF